MKILFHLIWLVFWFIDEVNFLFFNYLETTLTTKQCTYQLLNYKFKLIKIVSFFCSFLNFSFL